MVRKRTFAYAGVANQERLLLIKRGQYAIREFTLCTGAFKSIESELPSGTSHHNTPSNQRVNRLVDRGRRRPSGKYPQFLTNVQVFASTTLETPFSGSEPITDRPRTDRLGCLIGLERSPHQSSGIDLSVAAGEGRSKRTFRI